MNFKTLDLAQLIKMQQKCVDIVEAKKDAETKDMEDVKQQCIPQLESQFPKTTKNQSDCRSRYVHVVYKEKQYTVIGKPTYEHNIADGTYTLKSIEYRVEKGTVEFTNDSANNIVENMPVDGNTNVQDLQKELDDLMVKIKEKTERLRKLENAISGKGDMISSIGFVAVDPNSPDAVATLSKYIEEATKKLGELDKQIQQKNTEYQQKTEKLMQQKGMAKEADLEFDKLNQLYQDLREHYGLNVGPNNPAEIGIKQMVAPNKNDLNSLIDWYGQYLDMQKDNIDNLNEAIKNIKSSDKTGNADETAQRPTPDDKNEYLQNLKDETTTLNAKFDKVKKLYLDLCEHYGIDISNKQMPWQYMAASNSNDIDSQIEHYKQYIALQKDNIARTNVEIDKIVDSDNQPIINEEVLDRLIKLKSQMTPHWQPNS